MPPLTRLLPPDSVSHPRFAKPVSPLRLALTLGHVEAAQVLIDAGADAVFALSDALQCNYKTKLCWPLASRPPAVLVSGTGPGQLPLRAGHGAVSASHGFSTADRAHHSSLGTLAACGLAELIDRGRE